MSSKLLFVPAPRTILSGSNVVSHTCRTWGVSYFCPIFSRLSCVAVSCPCWHDLVRAIIFGKKKIVSPLSRTPVCSKKGVFSKKGKNILTGIQIL